jgi:photosystem II stability/assembly factor-like uncharacterized protein
MRRHRVLVPLLIAVLLLLSAAGFGRATLRVRAQSADALAASDLAALALRNIGPAAMSGRFVDLAVVESDPYTFYAASATGGIFKTTDNGLTFTPVFEHEAVHSIGAMAIFQADPNIVWVGTGERANRQSNSWGDGIYKSTDAGKTWTNVGLRDSQQVGRIVTHPTNPDIVFVAAMGHLWGPNKERGLYRTMDGGRTWQPVLQVNDDTGVVDVAMDPSDPSILYAAAYQRRRAAYGFNGGGPGSAFYKSTDGGSTWTKVTGAGLPAGEYGRIGISIYRKNPRIVYICIEQGEKYNASTAYIVPKGGIYRSEDKGATWMFMSTWNPRPMYASQITVDPNDDQRIYMVSYSFSDDGGRTFRQPVQSLHGDDRFVWVDPKDSRHVIKLDDGGVGVSYDRGLKWMYAAALPVSQFYRIAVDNERPYNVYGGLQDNGCWMGPSATYVASGILNDQWKRLCGGDGFFAMPDPTDSRVVYASSQFLGLLRNDTRTWEQQNIRPGNPKGAIEDRRNFDAYNQGLPDAELRNAMAPANWEAPFIVSPHDPKTLYAGEQHLFRSRNQGGTWEDLGDMSNGTDRRSLAIMDRKVSDTLLSEDDGVPYWPTISALAESPKRRGVLYVGSDDGRLRVSRDEGKTWTDVQDRLPGLPKGAWFAGIEPSHSAEGVVYVTVDNHRSDDFANYVYRSSDSGNTWTSIVGDLPAGRIARTIREDPINASLLYLGTEFGLFVTIDGGHHWVSFRNNLPSVPVNDLLVHPRDNDLVLGTHGRGVWILDSASALQELTPAVVASPAKLFTPKPAVEIRYTSLIAHTGDVFYRGDNPAPGGAIDYWLGAPASSVTISIHAAGGAEVARVLPTNHRGVNRVMWNLRAADITPTGVAGPAPPAAPQGRGRGRGNANTLTGPWVAPGTYTVRLTVNGQTQEKLIAVQDDPRIDVTPADRKQWVDTQTAIADLWKRAAALNAAVGRGSAGTMSNADGRVAADVQQRLSSLYAEVGNWTGRATADQLSQLGYYRTIVERLEKAR